jgi:hypothetical protein
LPLAQVHDLWLLPETLGARQRFQGLPAPPVPKFKGIVNPLSFVRLLRGPTTMVKLCLATFMVCWAEGKNTNDLCARVTVAVAQFVDTCSGRINCALLYLFRYQLWLQDGPGRGVGLGVTGGNIMTVLYGVLMFVGGKFFTPAIIRNPQPRSSFRSRVCID